MEARNRSALQREDRTTRGRTILSTTVGAAIARLRFTVIGDCIRNGCANESGGQCRHCIQTYSLMGPIGKCYAPCAAGSDAAQRAGATRRSETPPRPCTSFAACRMRMNVPATGIVLAGPGSVMRRGGEGRAQGPGPFAAATTG